MVSSFELRNINFDDSAHSFIHYFVGLARAVTAAAVGAGVAAPRPRVIK
jgi:hypothetical protein